MNKNADLLRLIYRTTLRDARKLDRLLGSSECRGLRKHIVASYAPQQLRLMIPADLIENCMIENADYSRVCKEMFSPSFFEKHPPQTILDRYNTYKALGLSQPPEESLKEEDSSLLKGQEDPITPSLHSAAGYLNNPFALPLLTPSSMSVTSPLLLVNHHAELLRYRDITESVYSALYQSTLSSSYSRRKGSSQLTTQQQDALIDFALASMRLFSGTLLPTAERLSAIPSPKYKLGTVFRHKSQGFIGVICRTDRFCSMPKEDALRMPTFNFYQPFYLSIVHSPFATTRNAPTHRLGI